MPANATALTRRRGRPAGRWYDAEEIAALVELPLPAVRGLLMRGAPFFSHARDSKREHDGKVVRMAPERDVRLFLELPRPEPCVKARTAAQWLDIPYGDVLRMMRTGSIAVREIGGRKRIPVSALGSIPTPPTPRPFSFFAKREVRP
jgi:hypothetical protein